MLNDLDLKKLDELLDLCQKRSVTHVTVGALSIDLQPKDLDNVAAAKPEPEVQWDPDTGLTMTPDEIRYYSKKMRAA